MSPIAWASVISGNKPPNSEVEQAFRAVMNRLADYVEAGLAERSIRKHASPLFRPFSFVTAIKPAAFVVVLAPSPGGIGNYRWVNDDAEALTPSSLAHSAEVELGWEVALAVELPRNGTDGRDQVVAQIASAHVVEVERTVAISRVKGADTIPHLSDYLREFLNDNPDPDRNVFLMMRFQDTEQMRSVNDSLRNSLAANGMNPLRADDKDYTGELWTNLQVYMAGCHLGVAVFEDIDNRDFNPNVSLELGYMLGTGRRCLLLKEKRLPTLPADVVNRLYKPFDAFKIESTIRAQVDRWVQVDLGHGRA